MEEKIDVEENGKRSSKRAGRGRKEQTKEEYLKEKQKTVELKTGTAGSI